MKNGTCLLLLFAFSNILYAAGLHDSIRQEALQVKETKRVNFFISTKTKKADPALMSSQFQAWLTGLFVKDKFYFIVVDSPEEMTEKVSEILERQHARIGSIWFDSHGHFSRRRSLFEIGQTEFSYLTIKDTAVTKPLRGLARYCDSETQVGIGSCYGGATYTLDAIEDFPESRMNGDSLMIALSELLNDAIIFGSESFVMTKPGMFMRSYSLAGLPTRKKFVDLIYTPVWENIGTWNCYVGSTGSFYRVKTVRLSGRGNIRSVNRDYLSFKRIQRKQAKKLASLKKGNYNLASLYQQRPA